MMKEKKSQSGPQPYVPDTGTKVVKKPPVAPEEVIFDLSLNESPFGANPAVAAAAAARCQRPNIYPDPGSLELRQAIGRCYGLEPERLICGNGSEEVLDAIGRLYARPGDEILYSRHAFIQFPIMALRTGATPVTAPERDFTLDVDALLERVTDKTRIVCVANPNNPTGTWVSRDDLVRLRDTLPEHIVYIIDSAYAEFVDDESYDDGLELIGGRPNVVVTRTLSKAFGLAAFRVGWGYGPEAMIRALNPMRGIGNVNAIAQAAAVAALDDLDFVAMVARETAARRDWLRAKLAPLGLEALPGAANFLAVRFPSTPGRTAQDAIDHMARRGILTRAMDDYGLDDFVRITIGSEAANAAVADALEDLLAGRSNVGGG